ncbi:MAG: hypothetical protein ABJZ55_15770 [Fuerstiella sp.]
MTLRRHAFAVKKLMTTGGRVFRVGLVAAIVMVVACGEASAADYPSGAGALEQFDAEARAALPPMMKGWLMLLLGTFAASVVFAWKKVEARWALLGLLLAMLAGPAFYSAVGWPMLGGAIALSHLVCWTPVLVVLALRRPFAKREHGKLYRGWSAILLTVIAISFVFDVRDAWIYLQHVQTSST